MGVGSTLEISAPSFAVNLELLYNIKPSEIILQTSETVAIFFSFLFFHYLY